MLRRQQLRVLGSSLLVIQTIKKNNHSSLLLLENLRNGYYHFSVSTSNENGSKGIEIDDSCPNRNSSKTIRSDNSDTSTTPLHANSRVGKKYSWQFSTRQQPNHEQLQYNNKRSMKTNSALVDNSSISHSGRKDLTMRNRSGNKSGALERKNFKRSHSSRLMNESMAREITQLFIDAYQSDINKSKRDTIHHKSSDRSKLSSSFTSMASSLNPWNATNWNAAEQALEFWARGRRNSGGRKKLHQPQKQQSPQQKQQQPSEFERSDADMALELFAALTYFTTIKGESQSVSSVSSPTTTNDDLTSSVQLTNGMYSHVIDALAKSSVLNHLQMADILLRQFISICLVRHWQMNGLDIDCSKWNSVLGGLDLPPVSDSNTLTSPKSSNPNLSQISDPFLTPSTMPPPSISSIQWNDHDHHHFPNQVRITGVMRGYARLGLSRDAESLLHLMLDLSRKDLFSMFNNKKLNDDNGGIKFSGYGLSDGGAKPAVRDAKSRNHFLDLKTMFRPNEIGYATVIDSYSRNCDGPNAERILQLMKGQHDVGSNNNGANVVAYNAAITAWARSASRASSNPRDSPTFLASINNLPFTTKSKSAALSADRLLQEMRNDPTGRLQPDVISYSAVISAYATCLDQPLGLEKANDLLHELEDLAVREHLESSSRGREAQRYETRGGRHPCGFRPNPVVYNTMIQSYANIGDASSAEAILDRMISLYSSSLQENLGSGAFRSVRPNTRTFNMVLNAWSKKGGPECGGRALAIWKRLGKIALEEERNGETYSRPDVITFNTVLAALAKSADVENRDGKEQIVGETAAQRAVELLDSIENPNLQPNQYNRGKNRGLTHIEPDEISYNTTISALANACKHCSNGVHLAMDAENLMTRMKKRGIEPSSYTFNSVMLAWGRSSGGLQSAQRAEALLRSMADPTIVSWTTVMNAYALADSARKVESLLNELEHQATKQNDHHLCNSIVVYNTVLHSLGRSSDDDAPARSEALLQRLERGSSFLPKPDFISYRLVLTTLEHCKHPDKALRARSVLDRFLQSMKKQSILPPLLQNNIQEAFNSVLTACAYTPSNASVHFRHEAARILVETFRDMNSYDWPGNDEDGNTKRNSGSIQESYTLFIQGCSHLLGSNPGERQVLITSAFQECCRKGLLNLVIWDKFCKFVPLEILRSTLKDHLGFNIDNNSETVTVRFEDLPPKWSERSSS